MILVYCVQILHRIHKIDSKKWLQSPYWEIHVVDENDPKEWLHMNTECQIVTGETCKCNVVSWNAQYVFGSIALGYIVTVAPKVGNGFPSKEFQN